ncbi:uncharacterized protein LOC121870990 [Homarus americanus]|uniref:uncharacterized protein LOC121870990 n=1 Tax=Homarus americanus TaxID=6706 RepID=UPI001C47164B|nr:uncharacterized protein LOC121870990 [Homarus americanus]
MVSVAQVRLHLKQGARLSSIDLENAYWHVRIHRRFKKILAFQVEGDVFQFTQLPFGLSLAPRVFTRIVRVLARELTHRNGDVFMYLDDWLISASSKEDGESSTRVTLATAEGMGFRINHPKSSLSPSQQQVWLEMLWDTSTASLPLSPDNSLRILRRFFVASLSVFTHRQWETLLVSPTFAAEVVPLGRLLLHRLTREVNAVEPKKLAHPMSPHLSALLLPWLSRDALRRWTLWVPSAPTFFVASYASDIGWGYQSSKGHQQFGGWTDKWRVAHINVRDLYVAWRFLEDNQTTQDEANCFEMDSTAAVFCLNRQGKAR